MRSFKTLLTVIGAVTVLVLASNTVALAATGHSFVLGKTNKANKVTVLKRTTAGPALNLRTTSSNAAPLVLNGKGKVANLNADTVDGLHATALQTRSTIYRIPGQTDVSVFELNFQGLPPGLYHVSFSIIAKMSAAGATINCLILRPNTEFYELMGYGSTFGNYSASNASGIMDTRTSSRQFRCFTAGGTATVDPDVDNQSQVVVTRIDGLATGALAAAP
jgi:hypothetical protein